MVSAIRGVGVQWVGRAGVRAPHVRNDMLPKEIIGIMIKGEDFLVHRFQRCGCTKALLRLAVMSHLHRSELLVCIECG